MKGITCCGDCGYYNWKRHKCTRCNNIESDARAKFYDDCPLPDVEKLKHGHWTSFRMLPNNLVVYECSSCETGFKLGRDVERIEEWSYCPACGADMRECNENL